MFTVETFDKYTQKVQAKYPSVSARKIGGKIVWFEEVLGYKVASLEKTKDNKEKFILK